MRFSSHGTSQIQDLGVISLYRYRLPDKTRIWFLELHRFSGCGFLVALLYSHAHPLFQDWTFSHSCPVVHHFTIDFSQTDFFTRAHHHLLFILIDSISSSLDFESLGGMTAALDCLAQFQ